MCKKSFHTEKLSLDAESKSKKLLWPTSENEVDWQLDLGTSLPGCKYLMSVWQALLEHFMIWLKLLHNWICQYSIWFSFVLHCELQSLWVIWIFHIFKTEDLGDVKDFVPNLSVLSCTYSTPIKDQVCTSFILLAFWQSVYDSCWVWTTIWKQKCLQSQTKVTSSVAALSFPSMSCKILERGDRPTIQGKSRPTNNPRKD